MSRRGRFLTGFLVVAVPLMLVGPAGARKALTQSLGPNVLVFDPSMPTSQIQATVDAIAAQQVANQFGHAALRAAVQARHLRHRRATRSTSRSATTPSVAGLGLSPNDVVINGSIYVHNQCVGAGNCIALNNFWRSLSNLTINVTNPNFGCYTGEFWAVSQAAPMRRVHVNGLTTLMDYCTGPSFASGGFIADSQFDGSTVINGSQQQWLVRNSELDGWTNGVWNQVFSGVVGAPAQCFPAAACGPYTTLADQPGDARGAVPVRGRRRRLQRLRPGGAAATPSARPGASGPTPGIVDPDRASSSSPSRPTPSQAINNALSRGKNLIFTPGRLPPRPDASRSSAADTVVLGLGFPTLMPTERRRRDDGRRRAGRATSPGCIFDAGPANSPVLLQVGKPDTPAASDTATDPTALQDVFFRIGGAAAGQGDDQPRSSTATTSSSTTSGPGAPTTATASAGPSTPPTPASIVNGDNVTAYGLFVEHYQKYEVIWNGERRHGHLLPERDALRPAEPGGVDGGSGRRRLGRLQGRQHGDQLQRLRHGQLQLLQPGRGHLRRARVRGPDHPAGGKPARSADDLPRRRRTARAAS